MEGKQNWLWLCCTFYPWNGRKDTCTLVDEVCTGGQKSLWEWVSTKYAAHIICGIMRHLRCNSKPEIDFFKDAEFTSFTSSLNAEMNRLQSMGIGSNHRQAEPLTNEEEELLWEKKILGDHTPQSLLKTMNGLYFALWSGDEYRNLRRSPCQIQVVEKPGKRPYLLYTEDISKNHPGGLKGRRVKPKIVTHHANTENPTKCFVCLFKLYCTLFPLEGPADAFYLSPLKSPRIGLPVFNCTGLAEQAIKSHFQHVQRLWYPGIHSLRATASTRLMCSLELQLHCNAFWCC